MRVSTACSICSRCFADKAPYIGEHAERRPAADGRHRPRADVTATLLLLDEPFIGVAPLVIEEVIAVLRRVAAEGMTILLVEQNVHRALDFVQRASVVESGRTVLSGTREELLADSGFGTKFLGLD